MPRPTNRSFIGSGYSFPFEITTDFGGIAVQAATTISSGTERLRQSLLLILYTNLGERVMNRTFGADFRSFVFEPMDQLVLDRITFSIRKAVELWEPRVLIERLDINLIDPKNGLMQVAVDFREVATNQPGNLVFPFFLGDSSIPGRLVSARTA